MPPLSDRARLSKRQWLLVAWIAIWMVVYTWMGVATVPVYIGIVMLLYFLIVTPVRAVPVWLLFILFAVGNVGVTWSTAGVQFLLQSITTRNDDFLGGVIAPWTEEIAKILPVLILYAWRRPRLRHAFGACDWMLCGAAVGAGVQLWEDIVIGATPTTGPHLFGLPLVAGCTPSFAGHIVTTAFVALGLGWARYLRRWFAFAPAAFVFIWMISDHAGNNLRSAQGWYWSLPRAVYRLGGSGRIAPYAFLLAFAATLSFEVVMLLRGSAAFGRWPPQRPFVQRLRWKFTELLLLHQRRYVQMATGITDASELYREVRRSEPGWSLRSLVRSRQT